MGAIVWWLFRQTINVQPWQAQRAADTTCTPAVLDAAGGEDGARGCSSCVATSLFALFISAYAMRMNFGDWKPLPAAAAAVANTAVLVVASVAMQWTAVAARRGDVDGVRKGLLVGGALTCAFLVGQLVAWRQLSARRATSSATNPANAFFYLLTAVHGVHVLGGLVAWGRTRLRAAARRRSRRGPPRAWNCALFTGISCS